MRLQQKDWEQSLDLMQSWISHEYSCCDVEENVKWLF